MTGSRTQATLPSDANPKGVLLLVRDSRASEPGRVHSRLSDNADELNTTSNGRPYDNITRQPFAVYYSIYYLVGLGRTWPSWD